MFVGPWEKENVLRVLNTVDIFLKIHNLSIVHQIGALHSLDGVGRKSIVCCYIVVFLL
jgi:endonuclease III